MVLCFAFVGGENNFINYTNNNKDEMKKLQSLPKTGVCTCCCFCFLGFFHTPSKFVSFIHGCMLQLLIFKPIFTAILSAIEIDTTANHSITITEKHHLHKVAWAFRILTAIVLFIVLYALFSLYRMLNHRMTGNRPVLKFFSIKLLVALTIVQRIILEGLVSHQKLKGIKLQSPEDRSVRIQQLLISLEMVIFSVIFFFVFSYKDNYKVNFGEVDKELVSNHDVAKNYDKVNNNSSLSQKLAVVFSLFDVFFRSTASSSSVAPLT